MADLGDVALADQHEARLGAQPAAVAHRAGAGSAVFGELFAHGDRIGFLVAAFEVGNDALEGVLLEHRLAAVGEVTEGDLVAPRAVQDHVADGGRQLLERRFHVEVVVVGEAGEKLEVELVAAVPAAHGAGGQRQIRVHDDPLGIEKVHLAKAVAAGAGAHRVVEREQARLEFGQRKAADRAGELGREQVLGAGIHLHGDGAAFGVGEGGFEGFRKAPAQILAHLDAIDHHLDAVTAVLVEHRQVVEFMDDAIHAYPHEALGAQFDEQVGLLALAAADHRGDDHQLGFFGQGQYRVHHLRDALGLEGVLGVIRAVGRAGAGVQQAQVVVDFGDRADGGARVVAGGLLLDGNGRRQTLDEVHVGLFHQLQKLPRVGRQRLHVAALAFGVQGVERQRAFARA